MAKQSRWRADARDLKRRRTRQAAARRMSLHAAEPLEARLALAVDAFTNEGLTSDWVVVVGDEADDIFMQRVATGEVGAPDQQDLLYANNSSFLNTGPSAFGEIDDIDSFGTLYVTNGTRVTLGNVFHDQYPLTSTALVQRPWTTTFVLSRAAIEDGEACFGTIAYGGNVWNFTNGVNPNSAPLAFDYPNAVFTFTGPGYPVPGNNPLTVLPIRPIDIGFADAANANGDAIAIVTWSGYPVVTPLAPEPTLTIRYDSNDAQRGPVIDPNPGDPLYVNYNQDFVTDVGRLPSAGAITTFTVPVTNVHPGGIVNGTLSGTIDVTGDGVRDFLFAPSELFGPNENQLVFTNIATGVGPSVTGTFFTGDADSNARTISGSYDPLRGTLLFRFTSAGVPQALNGLVTLVEVTYATYNQDAVPMSATFFAGLDIHNEVYVDLLTSGSTVNVESPIIHTTADTELGLAADIDLRATNVNVDATMAAFDEIRIGPSRVPFPDIAQASAYAVVGSPFLADGVTPNPAAGTIVDIVIPPGANGLGYNPGVLPVTIWIAPPPPGGTQATATALVRNGEITAIVIDNPGSGYVPGTSPQVSISPPPAQPPVPADELTPLPAVPGVASSAWGLFAVIGSDPAQTNFGQLIDVVVPVGGGGQGYDPANPPAIVIGPPPTGGVQATVTAVVVGGVVVDVTIVNPGFGYQPSPTSPPQVTIAPPQLPANVAPTSPGNARGFAVVAGGSVVAIAVPPGLGGQGYDPLSPPTVFIAAPPAGGVQAVATPVVQNGVVVAITIVNPGAGYTGIPAVTLSPPPDLPPIGPGFIDPESRQLPNPRPTGVAPVAEQVSIDAAVAAQFYDIRLSDDPNTAAFPRGRLFVSTSGSLSGSIPTAPGVVSTRAQRVFVQADDSDVIVEGRIAADEHTYLIQSRPADDADPTDGLEPAHVPYLLTTRSPATGSQTGMIAGGTVAITLGNDTPTAEIGAAALNTVDLMTTVDSIRVKAATRRGEPLTGPFPYDLTIAEFDDLSIDAVAASGRPINLSTGGDMRFSAALATGSDLTMKANGVFSLTAPVSSTRGQIDVVGTSVSVNNSLRVLDPVIDAARDDITLRATGGDINLAGLVSAVNNVNLIQANSDGLRPYSVSPIGGLPIRDNSIATQALTITEDYVFSDINVVVDIVHPDVRDLAIALVAPDGTIINLKNVGTVGGVSLNTANLTNTVFDSEAAGPITNAVAPHTGSFVPEQSLAPLYGRRTLGTWRLRVTDAVGGNQGRLLSFGLQFRINGPNYGNVGGPARVVAERVKVESQGLVSLFTNVDRLDGVAAVGFTVTEQDDIAITSLRSGGLVSLRAAGVDAGLGNRYTDNAIALTANLIDVTNLEASAPAGSIEIITDTARKLVLGRAQAIAAGQADPMQAAGNVVIRSKAGNIDVLDAPLGGLPQASVRVATTANLIATYAQNVPGTRSSTLTANGNGSLNAAGIDGVTNLIVGDRVLVRNQTVSRQNGIYVVTNLGSATSPWVLTRAADADTTAELTDNLAVTVLDGGQAGAEFKFVYDYTVNSGVASTEPPIVVTVVPNRPGAILVRAATDVSLFGTYNRVTRTITSVALESLPLINGVALNVGDRLLVRLGSHTIVDPRTLLPLNTTNLSNGVYQVTLPGGGGTNWVLTRVAEMDGFNDPVVPGAGAPDVTELLGYVNVREGSLSTPSVGGAYRVGFDALGVSSLAANPQVGVTTEIGSDALESLVTFVVSSPAGTNTGAGALGKMVTLRQENVIARLLQGDPAGSQDMDFRFSTLVTAPIQLTQQLPQLTRAFRVDGGRRYTPDGAPLTTTTRIVVDGSRITRDRFGRPLFTGTLSVTRAQASSSLQIPVGYTRFPEIRVGMLVTGSTIRQGARITAINPATRTLTLTPGSVVGNGTTSVTIAAEIHGLEFRAGSGAVPVDLDGDPTTPAVLQPGALLANVNVGGFANGAAITIDGTSGVVVRDSIIGQDANASRMSSRYGVLVLGATTSATLLNNVIVGHAGAGVRIQDTASGVVMVGNTIGSATLPNEVGVEILSTGMNRIGANPIDPTRALSAVTVTRSLATNSITLPTNYLSFSDLFVGLGVKGEGVAADARIAAINPTTRVIALTPGGVISNGRGSVTFGHFVDTVEFGTTLVLPVSVNMADLFLGQTVFGTGIRPSTTITAIDVTNRTITLSNPLTATASGVGVTFTAPRRNQIAFNRFGVWLAGGTNTLTNSDIYSNTFDGVRIVGGTQRVGTSTTASARSNAIYSNGGWGVNIVAPAVATQQTVQGNYIGTRAPGNVRLVNRLGNISPRLTQWTPNAVTNVDPQGNVHGPGRRPGSGSPTGPGIPFPLD